MNRYMAYVISGLKSGFSYTRDLPGGGRETLTPTECGRVKHEVASTEAGGNGGSSTLELSVLANGRWATDGWRLYYK